MKKALCIGINNYPVRGSDLKGCVNDAKAWAALLHEHYDFQTQDISMLLDGRATRQRILTELDKLLVGAAPGDVLVFTNSSHGTYVADEDGDETRYDEAMCPSDMKQNLIIDDELRKRFSSIPTGVRLTVISDSCFSGSLTRAPDGIETPDDRRKRFVSPARLGRPVLANPQEAKPKRGEKFSERSMKELLVSGCRDNQFSFDARFGTTYHGAMTYFALEIIKAANYKLTYAELWDQLVVRLEHEGYDQEPQVEGKKTSKKRMLFS